MSLEKIGRFVLRSAAATLVAQGVRTVFGKVRFSSGASSQLEFNNGRLNVTGDKVSSIVIRRVERELTGANVRKGKVILRKDGRVGFEGIPEKLHQRIRNIVNNP